MLEMIEQAAPTLECPTVSHVQDSWVMRRMNSSRAYHQRGGHRSCGLLPALFMRSWIAQLPVT